MASRKPKTKRPEPLKSYYSAWPENAVEQLQAAILKYKTRYKYVKVGITTDPKLTFANRCRCDEVNWQRMALKYRTDNAIIAERLRQVMINGEDWQSTDTWKVPTLLFEAQETYYLYFLLGKRKKSKQLLAPEKSTDYSIAIDDLLKSNITEESVVLDLFAGCGGLSLGFEAAGFKTIGYDILDTAVNTYNLNHVGQCHKDFLQPGYEYPEADKIDIIIGGPPCQPFSRRGSQKGIEDSRDGFPIFIDAVKRLQPKLFMFENVANLVGKHKWYFDLIIDELKKLGYKIEYRILNAVHYGVPQNRERLFCVGHKSKFMFPEPELRKTTVIEALGELMQQYDEDSMFLTPSQDKYIAEYEAKSHCVTPRDLYPHKPARTITCRNLAGATSDMQRIKLPDGRRRRITVREAARLQSFPDWYVFDGAQTSQFEQIGNAVPPLLAYKIALEVKKAVKRMEK